MCVCVWKGDIGGSNWCLLCGLERRRSGGLPYLWNDWPRDQVGESVFFGFRGIHVEMENVCPLGSNLNSKSSSVVYKLGDVVRSHGFPGLQLPPGGWGDDTYRVIDIKSLPPGSTALPRLPCPCRSHRHAWCQACEKWLMSHIEMVLWICWIKQNIGLKPVPPFSFSLMWLIGIENYMCDSQCMFIKQSCSR